ncbi:MAG TPA: carboxypeptidase regulatory-like domain-containing protein [Candidatus Sulfotelmatobacter sp.]|nr:carboxypeptidase regulatory-like domain-containing protein [Candidatus Sulfotelmatobacter sp.]
MRALLLTLVLVSSAAAQSVPTVIVTDENGVAVPSARVFLRFLSQPPISSGFCQTDFAGRCQFPSFPEGAYELRVEKEGFYALVQPSVQITPSSTIEVTISHQQEVKEVVDVRESPPAIDPAQVAAQETISGLDVLNIVYPVTHDYRNALNFIPGVVSDQFGQPHVAGSQTYQTVTLLDGFNVTQPANGLLVVRVSTDAFRSIQVEPSREPAEDGKGSGGVLNLNTGIGDDHFRFTATNFIPSFQNKHGWRFDQFLPRFTMSGPVVKGKIWFYDAFDGEYDNTIYNELPVGQDNDHVLRLGNLAKVQSNLTARDILTTSFLVNDLYDKYGLLSPLNPQLTNPKNDSSSYVTSVKEQHYFAGGQLLETGFAFNQYDAHLSPYGTEPYQPTPDTAFGNYYLTEQTRARRWQGLANLYLPPQQWHGRHDFKVGVDLDRLSYFAQFSRQPITYLTSAVTSAQPADVCFTTGQDATFPCTRYSTFGAAPLHSEYNTEVSAYAEDRWSVTNRLLIEPGVRLDWDEIVRHAEISPRLAGTYVLDNTGNTKLSAGIGLVYDATPIFLIARPFAGTRQDIFYSISDPTTCTPPNCVVTTGPVTTTFAANASTFQAPRFLNWSIGLEKKLPAAIYMKAEFLQKRGTRGFVYDAPPPTSTDFFLQNTRDDHYDAFQLTLRHNFRENYTLMGSYTRSSARSNQALDFNVDSPILSPQQPGPYSWDTPNRFLSWGYLPFFKLPIIHQLEVAYSLEARTGFPFSLFNDQQQLISKPGAERFPKYFSANLQLEKRFHLFGYYLALRGGFDNITGRCNPLVVNSVIDASNPQPTFSACQGRSFTSRIRLLGKK